MTKQIYIFNQLKANLKVLLMVCFAMLMCSNIAFADTISITPTPTGVSQVYRQNPKNTDGSSNVFDKEYRNFKKALNNTLGNGKGTGVFTYTRGLLGDAVSAGLDYVDKGISKAYDTIETEMPDGFLKKILVTYNPNYHISKFAVKGAVKIAKAITPLVFAQTNRECNKERMDSIYKNGCYACEVVKSLVGSFINACTYLYDISKEAGVKILVLGFVLWLAFFVLQQISSLKNMEPAAMVTIMLIMAFKTLGAYLVIIAGSDFFIEYAIIPFMQWGAQFGIAMLAGASVASGLDISSIQLDDAYLMDGGPIPVGFLNNLQVYVAAVDYTVSTHMEIGHMLTCHATHAGALDWVIARIPNFWIWLSGAFIWFCGFMMTLSVAYYLVDISFKLGFAIIALPITVALWPFAITKDRLTNCFSIILKSAGLLIFLAITVAISLALLANALDIGSDAALSETVNAILTTNSSGTDKMIAAIEEGNNEFINSRLSFWSFGWIIIVFAYLFGIKMVGSTDSDYASSFFPDKLFSKNSPMHMMMTQATDMAKHVVSAPVSYASDVVSHQSKVGLDKVAGKFFGGGNNKDSDSGLLDKAAEAKNTVNQLTDGNLDGGEKKPEKKSTLESARSMAQLDGDKDKKEMEKKSTGGGSNSVETAGKAVSESGRQIEQAADTLDQTLQSADQTVQGANQAVQGGANALNATVVGAPIGIAASAASQTATTATSASLKAGRVVAQTMKTMGKTMKEAGKAMEAAGKEIEKAKKTEDKTKTEAKETEKQDGKQGENGQEQDSQKENNNTNKVKDTHKGNGGNTEKLADGKKE